MDSMVRLTGKKAVVAAIVIVVVAVAQFALRTQSLQTDAVDAVKMHLAAEYARDHLPDLQQAVSSGLTTDAGMDEMIDRMSPESIEVVSISALGRKGRYTARVELRVADSEPTVRYFRMQHSMVAGWRVVSESSALQYYLSF